MAFALLVRFSSQPNTPICHWLPPLAPGPQVVLNSGPCGDYTPSGSVTVGLCPGGGREAALFRGLDSGWGSEHAQSLLEPETQPSLPSRTHTHTHTPLLNK